ncbi:salivary cystatin-L2-like [Haemaphysalis longicornis]
MAPFLNKHTCNPSAVVKLNAEDKLAPVYIAVEFRATPEKRRCLRNLRNPSLPLPEVIEVFATTINKDCTMVSSSTTACVLAVVSVGLFVCCTAQLVGGWHPQTDTGNEHYHKLAHLAVSQQVQGRRFYDTVLKVTKVETQTVAGRNYRITFKTAESTCPVTAVYSKKACRPKTRQVKATCTAVIYEGLGQHQTTVNSFTCG